jgi:hypothetical protein
MEDTGHPIRWQELDTVIDRGEYDSTLIAAVLAKDGYLDDVDAWAWDFDYRLKAYLKGVGETMLTKIHAIQGDANGKIASAKVDTSFRGKGGFPISVCGVVAANSCINDDFFPNAGEIPIAYSQGQCDDNMETGTWAESKINFDQGGAFGNKGDVIVFLDGHVEWYDNLGVVNRYALKKYGINVMTNKIDEAIPMGGIGSIPTNSAVLSWKGSKQDCGTFRETFSERIAAIIGCFTP